MQAGGQMKDLYPFVKAYGWSRGLAEYDRAWIGRHAHSAGNKEWFSPLQGMWKLLLPETLNKDIFIADITYGSIPLELSKSCRRVFAFSFLEYSAQITAERAKEAGVSNIVTLEEVAKEKLQEQGATVGTSIIVVSEDVVKGFGRDSLYAGIEQLLEKVSGVADKSWTNVFVYPKKFYFQDFLKIKNEFGLTMTSLKRIHGKHHLTGAYSYDLMGASERPREVKIGGMRGEASKLLRSESLGSFLRGAGHSIKKCSYSCPARLAAFSKSDPPATSLSRFLSCLTREVRGLGRVSVVKYVIGHPSMILLELKDDLQQEFFCRMPLGRGISLKRALNNYRALRYLSAKERVAAVVPRPYHQGEFDGQPFSLETRVKGKEIKMTRANQKEVIAMIWPVLTAFHDDLGKSGIVDKGLFGELLGESLSMIKSRALNGNDREKIGVLEELLKKRLINKGVRLALVHGDFKVENMLFDQGRLTGIFDWDLSAEFGFPFMDLFYLYGYSFFDRRGDAGYGMLDFITSQVLTGQYEPALEELYQSYAGALSISEDWKDVAGCLFWLHYVTKIRELALSVSSSRWYIDAVRRGVDLSISLLGETPC